MKISPSSKVSIPEKVLLREVADEAMVLNLNNERYYGLDQVGTRFWTVLTTSASIQEAIDALLVEYDVDRATLDLDETTEWEISTYPILDEDENIVQAILLEQDVTDLVSKLAVQGLIELNDE